MSNSSPHPDLMTRAEADEISVRMIPLTQGEFALVDVEDYERLAQYKWRLGSKGYAIRTFKDVSGKKRTLSMHRVIMDAPPRTETDHINGDRLDNRKANLRICSTMENQRNRGIQVNSTTGFKGVSPHKASGKYEGKIGHKKEKIYLGLFSSPEEAARAYDAMARKLFGEFARLNFADDEAA